MTVDFGGIVKEYAADAVAKLARTLGVAHGLINLGGDFAVIGPQLDGQAWTVGVANPKQEQSLMAKIDLLDGGLASSGDYERFFMHEGKRYSHILNPKTGWPSSGLRAVSVAANLCTVAGSVATIAMLKEESDAIAWLQESGLSHVYMDSNEEVSGVGLKSD
jgi:thiamine biosynthesis lipoprotein